MSLIKQVWFLLYGSGSNGKSTFLSALAQVFGEYARTIPFHTVLLPEASIPSDIAGLVGKRFVYASESIQSAKLNEARIKALTGGDRIAARHLWGQWFEYDPNLKLWLTCNHPPTVQDDTYGFWRRVQVIPFLKRFEGTGQDKELLKKLKAEAAGILRWMVRGCLMWQREGLNPPACVLEAAEAYKRESDRGGPHPSDSSAAQLR